MKKKIIVKRYADAFISYAHLTIGLQNAIGEMRRIKTILRENPELNDFFAGRNISYREKTAFIDQVFGGVLLEGTRSFLKLLVEKERIELLADIADYIRLTYAHGEAIDAVLKTTFPLETELIGTLKTHLENIVGKKLNLFIDMDPDLMGGIRAEVGNTVIDGSVRRRLEDLRQRLLNVRIN